MPDIAIMRRYGLILLLASSVVVASCKRSDEHHGLVKAVAKGQPGQAGGGSGDGGTGSAGPSEVPAPPADSPYIGLWEQTSQTERRVMRVRFNLTRDGLFMADGSIEERETGDRAQITVHGRWFIAGDAVLMRIEATDQPGAFPPASVLTYAKSAIDSGAWKYLDGAGRARSMSRIGSQADASGAD